MRWTVKLYDAALVAGLVVFGAAVADATDTPLSCLAHDGNRTTWSVSATEPMQFACGTDTCTTMTYAVSGSTPDHMVIEATHDVTVVPMSGVNISPECEPDDRIKEAGGSCAYQAIRLNSAGSSPPNVTEYTLTVEGAKNLVSSTIYLQDGNKKARCLIASLGEDPAPQLAEGEGIETEITLKTLGECFTTIPRDAETGELGDAFFVDANGNILDPLDPNTPCEFLTNRDDQQKILFFLEDADDPINNPPTNLGEVIFNTQNDEGVGFKIGQQSCYTKFYQPPGINYTWCTKDK